MSTGYCRHEWTDCSESLSEVFPAHAGLERRFRACGRCLRLQEIEPRPVAVDFAPRSVVDGLPPSGGETDERAA